MEQISSILFYLQYHVEQFYIDSKVNLSSYVDIQDFFVSECVLGVTISKKVVAILSDLYLEEILYHEMLHLTQSDDSYFVSSSYFFSHLIQDAMKEGEAVYYDIQFAKYKFPESLHYDCNENIVFGNHSIFYQVCREFYLDMRTLLNKDLFSRWKTNSFLESDFMQEAKTYVFNKYSIDFMSFYHIWSVLLYYFSINSNLSSFSSLANQDLDCIQSLSVDLFNYYDSLIHYYSKILEHNVEILNFVDENFDMDFFIFLKKSCEQQTKKISFISRQKNFLKILLSLKDISCSKVRRFAYIKEILIKRALGESENIVFNDMKPSLFYTFKDDVYEEDDVYEKIYSLYL